MNLMTEAKETADDKNKWESGGTKITTTKRRITKRK